MNAIYQRYFNCNFLKFKTQVVFYFTDNVTLINLLYTIVNKKLTMLLHT